MNCRTPSLCPFADVQQKLTKLRDERALLKEVLAKSFNQLMAHDGDKDYLRILIHIHKHLLVNLSQESNSFLTEPPSASMEWKMNTEWDSRQLNLTAATPA